MLLGVGSKIISKRTILPYYWLIKLKLFIVSIMLKMFVGNSVHV